MRAEHLGLEFQNSFSVMYYYYSIIIIIIIIVIIIIIIIIIISSFVWVPLLKKGTEPTTTQRDFLKSG